MPRSDDDVENVQLTWPIRDRAALIAALTADPAIHVDVAAPIDPDDEAAPDADQFVLLDRPEIKQLDPSMKIEDIPQIVARVFVGADTVALETYDDGRLDRLSGRFTALAGRGIPPAHPKTKLIGKVPRLHLALMWEWLLPDGLDRRGCPRGSTASKGSG